MFIHWLPLHPSLMISLWSLTFPLQFPLVVSICPTLSPFCTSEPIPTGTNNSQLIAFGPESFLSWGPHLQLAVQCLHSDIPQVPEIYHIPSKLPTFPTHPAASPLMFSSSENGRILHLAVACSRLYPWPQFFTFPTSTALPWPHPHHLALGCSQDSG